MGYIETSLCGLPAASIADFHPAALDAPLSDVMVPSGAELSQKQAPIVTHDWYKDDLQTLGPRDPAAEPDSSGRACNGIPLAGYQINGQYHVGAITRKSTPFMRMFGHYTTFFLSFSC